MWSHGIIDVIEKAKDMNIEDSNQFSEAVIRTTKLIEGANDHKSEPARYILFRSVETKNAIKQFALQYRSLDARIRGLESRREARGKKRSHKEVSSEKSEDMLTQEAEEMQSEVWSRKGSRKEVESTLRDELKSLFKEKCVKDSWRSKHNYALSCLDSDEDRKAFMSYSTFKDFMSETRKSQKALQKEHKEPLQVLISKIHPAKEPAIDESVVIAVGESAVDDSAVDESTTIGETAQVCQRNVHYSSAPHCIEL